MAGNILALAAAWVLLAAGTTTGEQHAADYPHYALIIDAGSSGSRVHIFNYALGAAGQVEVLLPDKQLSVKPGLSAYAAEPPRCQASLRKLLEYAKTQVPLAQWERTPVRLLATAGVRLLPPAQAQAVLLQAGQALQESGFKYQPGWARTLPGQLEGAYAWLAFNYAAGLLQAAGSKSGASKNGSSSTAAPAGTLGVLEMGGASTQITFALASGNPAALTAPPAGSTGSTVRLQPPGAAQPLTLFSRSFLGAGLDSAWFRAGLLVSQAASNGSSSSSKGEAAAPGGKARSDPCLPAGQTTPAGIAGAGNFDACAQVAEAVLPTLNCSGSSSGSSSAVTGRCMPKLPAGGVLLATENFHYTAYRLGLPPNATLRAWRAAGTRLCALPWPALQAELVVKRKVREDAALKTCFASAYAWALLSRLLGLPQDAEGSVRFSNSVWSPAAGAAVDVNWALGALLQEAIPAELLDGSKTAGKAPNRSPANGMPLPARQPGMWQLSSAHWSGLLALLLVALAGAVMWLRRLPAVPVAAAAAGLAARVHRGGSGPSTPDSAADVEPGQGKR